MNTERKGTRDGSGRGAGGKGISDPPSCRDMGPWTMHWCVSPLRAPTKTCSPQPGGDRGASALHSHGACWQGGGQGSCLPPHRAPHKASFKSKFCTRENQGEDNAQFHCHIYIVFQWLLRRSLSLLPKSKPELSRIVHFQPPISFFLGMFLVGHHHST